MIKNNGSALFSVKPYHLKLKKATTTAAAATTNATTTKNDRARKKNKWIAAYGSFAMRISNNTLAQFPNSRIMQTSSSVRQKQNWPFSRFESVLNITFAHERIYPIVRLFGWWLLFDFFLFLLINTKRDPKKNKHS